MGESNHIVMEYIFILITSTTNYHEWQVGNDSMVYNDYIFNVFNIEGYLGEFATSLL